jgi:5-methylcytosine-specific restriction endonuclease McrA
VKEYNAHYHAANAEKNRQYMARYRSENPEKIRERNARYCDTHREEYRKSKARYQAAHRDAISEYQAKYRAENCEALSEYQAKYYEAHRDRILERVSRYRASNPEKIREWSARRRAMERSATVGDKKAIQRVYGLAENGSGIHCYLCGRLVPKGERHVDHVIPLSRGGLHTASNLDIACALCNVKKGAKLPEEVGMLVLIPA